jgi:hypothetical protein
MIVVKVDIGKGSNMKVYNVSPGKDCNYHVEVNIDIAIEAAKEWLKEAEPGEIISITVDEMSEKEYNDLSDYVGP